MEYSHLVADVPALYEDQDADQYLRRLSVYATLRASDYHTLLGGKPSKKTLKKDVGLSLQNLFTGVGNQFVPDYQTPSIQEADEETSSCEDVRESYPEVPAVTVHGSSVQDLPVEYTVNGLRQHEFPVIGGYHIWYVLIRPE